jgi:peptidoglycan/xylan/chitin deacetylase (PgdA/CDA1 family)
VTGAVALTFDDGPDRTWTPALLALLERRGARATFFVDARRALAERELLGEIRAQGHEIGFHCFEHVRHSERTPAQMNAEVGTGLGLLAGLGVRPRAWRAPWGIETAATRALAAEHGLRLWHWDLDSHDWRGDSAATMFAAIGGELRDGSVVLMHDGIGPGARRDGCAETLALTELLLDAAEDEGLGTASVSQLRGTVMA